MGNDGKQYEAAWVLLYWILKDYLDMYLSSKWLHLYWPGYSVARYGEEYLFCVIVKEKGQMNRLSKKIIQSTYWINIWTHLPPWISCWSRTFASVSRSEVNALMEGFEKQSKWSGVRPCSSTKLTSSGFEWQRFTTPSSTWCSQSLCNTVHVMISRFVFYEVKIGSRFEIMDWRSIREPSRVLEFSSMFDISEQLGYW